MSSPGRETADPRIARTRRDVIRATAEILTEDGWDAVVHAEVAQRAGYSKATVYTHWPTKLDLIRDAIEEICDSADHPPATGDLRADIRASLADFAADLTDGHLDQLLGGVVERANRSEVVKQLRGRLYETGTDPMRAILAAHIEPARVDLVLELLTGAVFTHVTFEGKPATTPYLDVLVDTVLGPRRPNEA